MWGWKPKPPPDWFTAFADELEAFVQGLPGGLVVQWKKSRRHVSLGIKAPTSRHRDIWLELGPDGGEYAVGKVWGEYDWGSEEIAQNLLATLDALKAGQVREVRDRRTGAYYHVYRLKTRGLDGFMQEGQFRFFGGFKIPVRKATISRISPLDSTREPGLQTPEARP